MDQYKRVLLGETKNEMKTTECSFIQQLLNMIQNPKMMINAMQYT